MKLHSVGKKRILVFCPKMYSLDRMFQKGFEANGFDTYIYDYRANLSDILKKLFSHRNLLTYKLRKQFNDIVFSKINKRHIEIFEEIEPDIVLIYNHEMFLPSTLKFIGKSATIFFYLGDSPFYSKTENKYNLSLLEHANSILVPDTFWIQQLRQIGYTNMHHFITYPTIQVNNTIENRFSISNSDQCDFIYIGRSYNHSWGYKRALFLSKFTGYNLQVFGDKSWDQWLDCFDGLKDHFTRIDGRLDQNKMVEKLRQSKIYPVDSNPGIVNGLHLRIFDSISNGVLPIIEYRKDIDLVFQGIEVPLIHSYSECKKIADKYLNDDDLRISVLKGLRRYVGENLNPERVVLKLLEKII